MNIFISNIQESLHIDLKSVRSVVHEVLSLEHQQCDEVSINFVETSEICELHVRYFDDPTPTDCISFPIDDGVPIDNYKILGEIVICPQTALKYVKSHGGNVYEETYLYIIHSLLHLMGYDDIEEHDKHKMRNAEKRHMEHLKSLNLIPTTKEP